MISSARLTEIETLIRLNGEEEARKILKLSQETFNRYKRFLKLPRLKSVTKAKILLIDIETLYMVGGFWRPWKQNIQPEQIFKRTCLLSWSAKWLGDYRIMGEVLTPREAKNRNDGRIVKHLWQLMNQADIIVAHNGRAFDIPRIKTFCIIHHLPPPSSYFLVDTYKEAKKFGFDYNRLGWLAEALGIPYRKIETSFDLWVDCDKGNKKALKSMLKYNKVDVLILEEIYYRLRGWIKSHPNLNLYAKKEVCSNCGSENIKKQGQYHTPVNTYISYVCLDCGAYSRQTKNKHYKLVSVAH